MCSEIKLFLEDNLMCKIIEDVLSMLVLPLVYELKIQYYHNYPSLKKIRTSNMNLLNGDLTGVQNESLFFVYKGGIVECKSTWGVSDESLGEILKYSSNENLELVIISRKISWIKSGSTIIDIKPNDIKRELILMVYDLGVKCKNCGELISGNVCNSIIELIFLYKKIKDFEYSLNFFINCET